jgi:hypothetical protein
VLLGELFSRLSATLSSFLSREHASWRSEVCRKKKSSPGDPASFLIQRLAIVRDDLAVQPPWWPEELPGVLPTVRDIELTFLGRWSSRSPKLSWRLKEREPVRSGWREQQ